jgi:hypothetical protein
MTRSPHIEADQKFLAQTKSNDQIAKLEQSDISNVNNAFYMLQSRLKEAKVRAVLKEDRFQDTNIIEASVDNILETLKHEISSLSADVENELYAVLNYYSDVRQYKNDIEHRIEEERQATILANSAEEDMEWPIFDDLEARHNRREENRRAEYLALEDDVRADFASEIQQQIANITPLNNGSSTANKKLKKRNLANIK